jgi:WbqC-like protein family
MKMAIMQPYFFPYIGYWQLIHAVDRFIIYDDVNFIKRGWVNRNRILINGEATYIVAPIIKASQNKKICDLSLDPWPVWKDKMVKSIEMAYRKSPFFAQLYPLIEKLICHEADNLSDYLSHQLQAMASFTGIKTEFVVTSRFYGNNDLSGEARILDICKREGATTYINPQGGQALYDTETFHNAAIDLRFIVMRPISYKQRANRFVPHLSIIDALMEIGPVEIMHHLDAFDLVSTA